MPAEIGPAGSSIFIPTGPAPDYSQLVQNDPFFQQQLEWLDQQKATTQTRLAEDKLLAQQLYDLNKQQAQQSASGGGDYGIGAAQVQAQIAKDKAAHDLANQQEFMREALASRGMASSGQAPWEQNEATWQYQQLLKGIDADLNARVSAASSARASAQAGLALQLKEMELRHQANMTGFNRAGEDLDMNYGRDKGSIYMDAYTRLAGSGAFNAPGKNAFWDSTAGVYVDADGNFFDEFGKPVAKLPGPGAGPVGPGPGAGAPLPPYVVPPGAYTPPVAPRGGPHLAV